ncbi:MAG TPA: DNA internalization-related competence protein ComEC/Rec2 [Armatimonadetes bacterium]|jgi:competence protein ComEC|nr:DNA internalization-related competence protein ComEC/Rec2 [Armatimonadota bacterium]
MPASRSRPAHNSWLDAISVGLGAALVGRPLLFIAGSLIVGIVWADRVCPAVLPTALLGVLALALWGLFVWYDARWDGLVLCLAVALGGAALHSHTITPGASDPVHFADVRPLDLTGTVQRVESRARHEQKVVLRVDSVRCAGTELNARGKTLCKLPSTPVVRSGYTIESPLTYLTPPDTAGNPGQQDSRGRLARRGIHTMAQAHEVRVLAVEPVRASADTTICLLREHIVTIFEKAMPGRDPEESTLYAHLLAAMVFGMRSADLPDDVEDAFRRSGTIHLMVVSGAQISIVALAIICLVCGDRVRVPIWMALLVIPPLVVYAGVAGMSASVVRSLAMAGLMVLGLIAGRKYDVWTATALAAVVLCVADTSSPFSPGCQLTFAALLGIVLFMPRLEPLPVHAGIGRRLGRYGLGLAGATLGAWLMTTPILAYHFHSIVLVGIVANLLVVPMSVLVVALGFVTFILGSASQLLAVLPAGLARPVLWLVLQIVTFFGGIEGSALQNVHFTPLGGAAWYLGVGVVWWLVYGSVGSAAEQTRPEARRRLVIAVFALGAMCLLLAALVFTPLPGLHIRRPEPLRMAVLDVGEGQCMVISTPDGRHIMVDAGTGPRSPWRYRDVAERVIVPYLAHARIRHLDALIMSHADSDHSSGMAQILHTVGVGGFIVNRPPAADQPDALAACAAARARGIESTILRRGDNLSVSEGIALSVLHPPDEWCENPDLNENNCSLVLRLQYGQTSVLMPGDIEARAEEELLRWAREEGIGLRSTALILPHHGSDSSSTEAFLDAVNPSVAVVCGARARLRPAHPTVIERLRQRRIALLSTDALGMIELTTDGTTLHWQSFREAKASSG